MIIKIIKFSKAEGLLFSSEIKKTVTLLSHLKQELLIIIDLCVWNVTDKC